MWFYSLARGVFLSKQFNLFNTNTLQLLLKINHALIWLKNTWKFIATLLILSDITYDTCSTLLGNNPIEYLHSEQIRTIRSSNLLKGNLLFYWSVNSSEQCFFTTVTHKKFLVTLSEKCPNLKLSWRVFSRIGLNTDIFRVNLCVQSKFGKIRTRKKFWIRTIFSQRNLTLKIYLFPFRGWLICFPKQTTQQKKTYRILSKEPPGAYKFFLNLRGALIWERGAFKRGVLIKLFWKLLWNPRNTI